jgi:hypothetical protein
MADILWQDSAGDLSIWFMNGISVFQNPPPASVGNPGPFWSVVGTGDFNADGKADIVFRYYNAGNMNDMNNGAVAIWLMNGGNVANILGLGVVNPVYSIASTGDYNRDGTSDFLWLDTSTGAASVWFMDKNTGKVLSTLSIGGLAAPWTIISTNSD